MIRQNSLNSAVALMKVQTFDAHMIVFYFQRKDFDSGKASKNMSDRMDWSEMEGKDERMMRRCYVTFMCRHQRSSGLIDIFILISENVEYYILETCFLTECIA